MKCLLIVNVIDTLLNSRGPLIKMMLQNGHTVMVAAPGLRLDNPVAQTIVAMGGQVSDIPLRRISTNPLQDAFLMLALWRLMRRWQPDLIIAYTIKPIVYGMLAGRLARVPRRFALVTGLGYAFTLKTTGVSGALKALVLRLYGLALSNAHKVFFQNPDDRALLISLGLLPRDLPNVVVNGSGVDLDYYASAPVPDGEPHFLMIGRFLLDKGIHEYVQAARNLRRKHPKISFSLVGWIDENPAAIAQSELNDWIAQGDIEFLGRLVDVRPAILNASVFVLPSYGEGTPRTVLEAMSMGRSIITTDAPGCRETVIEGRNGFLIAVRSVTELERAMAMFIENPALAKVMGPASRQIAEEKYDVHNVNTIMLREMGMPTAHPKQV
ncbi:glycosyltransferase [Duganella sp. FT50W]|uniref:Glycosyltransferase n=1 Tax=Duganella lactea TaxID=2692173 RepID=A0A6L8ML68_9BURK|nr:glycosyltransferase family 4 protein [Duganella lactea]MYM82961.1 glycosyltransferase [Duganella lactea]